MAYNPRDHYFEKAKDQNFAARSVFKLEEIDQKLKILSPTDPRIKVWIDPDGQGIVIDETNRVNQEIVRQSNEDTRITNENTRISNENTRISQESSRASAESTRISMNKVE